MVATGRALADGQAGAAGDQAEDPVRMLGGDDQATLRGQGPGDEHGAVRGRRIHHGEDVGCHLALGVGLGRGRAVRSPVAARIEGHDPSEPGEIRDLWLPEARVDDLPGRDEHDRGLALAVDLVRDPDAVALDEARLVRVPGAGLLRPPCVGGRRRLRRGGVRRADHGRLPTATTST